MKKMPDILFFSLLPVLYISMRLGL